MNQSSDTLVTLALHFALMSLFAIGGANAAVPEMHRLAVEVMHWMTDRQFTDLFAIAQVTPGPNVIIVTLIGYHVAGLPGALVTTVAMCGPTCLFAAIVGRVWDRFRTAKWRDRHPGRPRPVVHWPACRERLHRGAGCRPELGGGRHHGCNRRLQLLDPVEPALALCRSRVGGRRGFDIACGGAPGRKQR